MKTVISVLGATLRALFVLAVWPFVRAAYWATGAELHTSLREGLKFAIQFEEQDGGTPDPSAHPRGRPGGPS